MQATVNEIRFSDDDVVNPEDFLPTDAYSPHSVKPFLLHDAGFTLGVVFAESLQDALDIAADAGHLDSFRVSDLDSADYPDDDGVSFLGNDSARYDVDLVDAVELQNPVFSFVALFNAEVAR